MDEGRDDRRSAPSFGVVLRLVAAEDVKHVVPAVVREHEVDADWQGVKRVAERRPEPASFKTRSRRLDLGTDAEVFADLVVDEETEVERVPTAGGVRSLSNTLYA